MNKDLEAFYKAYLHKKLAPETALELSFDFTLDLINAFGDILKEMPPLPGWKQFAPIEFILSLNNLLAKYKEEGFQALSDSEKQLLTDSGLLFGTLVRSALTTHPDSYPNEDHFQLPEELAADLEKLAVKY